MVPNEVINGFDPPPLATGTDGTCAAQAFMWNLFFYAGYGSNATLAITYWLTVCRGRTESKLKQCNWQFLLLGLPWLLGLIDAVVGTVFKFHSYNRLWFCASLSDVKDPVRWRLLQFAAFFLVTNLVILLSMGALIRFVYVTEKKSKTYRRSSSISNISRSKSTLVTAQGIWFIVAYMAVVLPSLFTLVTTPTPEYIVFMACLHPLQGLFNAFVYFRPKYESERRRIYSSSNPTERRATKMSSVLKVLNISIRGSDGGNTPQNNDVNQEADTYDSNEEEEREAQKKNWGLEKASNCNGTNKDNESNLSVADVDELNANENNHRNHSSV